MNATDFVRSAVGALGWAASEVTLYPVRAEDVAAYRAAGLEGTAATGVVEVRRIISAEGDVGVATTLVTFKTDAQTAEQVSIRRWSLVYEGSTFDIVGKGPVRPGDVDLYLQEYR